MSRVGRQPIALPERVKVDIDGTHVTVRGPKGDLSRDVSPEMSLRLEEGQLLVSRPSDAPRHRALHGLTRSLIANMVIGVSKGYEKSLEISGVGFKAIAQKDNLMLSLGFSHPVVFPMPKGVKATVDQKQTTITLKGIDKQLIGQIAANLRGLKKPEPYKGKGIKYSTEVIHRKEGKAGKGGK